MKNWLRLVISIFLPLAIGAMAGMFTSSEINGWFQSLEKPSWQPPNWVFGPVWTVLYIMMGIAFYLVWKKKETPKGMKRTAITLWIIQLVFNFLWSYIFFKEHQLDWALGEILVLWFFILLTILFFARISKLAAWLMVPYISWVTFASLLTFAIYELNGPIPSGPHLPRWGETATAKRRLIRAAFPVQLCSNVRNVDMCDSACYVTSSNKVFIDVLLPVT